MKPQTPAEGILVTNDYGDSKWYRIVCGCGQPDHELSFEVDADESGVNVNTYVTVKSNYWNETFKKRYDIDNVWLQEFDWAIKDFVNGFIRRVQLTWTLWTKGYVQTETTILMSEQQALNYANVLTTAIDDVKMFRDKRLNKDSKNA